MRQDEKEKIDAETKKVKKLTEISILNYKNI